MAEHEVSLGKTLITGVVVVVLHVGLWLAFVFKTSGPEWTLGTIGAAAAAVVTIAFAQQAQLRFRVALRWIAQGWRLPLYVVRDTAKVGMALGKQLFIRDGADSYLAAVPYDACKPTPEDAGKRAFEIVYMTSTPNGMVLGVVEEQGLLLFHQVKKDTLSQMTENLGAHPVKGGGG